MVPTRIFFDVPPKRPCTFVNMYPSLVAPSQVPTVEVYPEDWAFVSAAISDATDFPVVGDFIAE
ncbi:hypothetical protein D3C80_1899660 [compost metagenome]